MVTLGETAGDGKLRISFLAAFHDVIDVLATTVVTRGEAFLAQRVVRNV